MKRTAIAALLLTGFMPIQADTISVNRYWHARPTGIHQPYATDSLDVTSSPFNIEKILKAHHINRLDYSQCELRDSILQASTADYTLNMVGFNLSLERWQPVTFTISGSKHHHLFVDGTQVTDAKAMLGTGTHRVIIKSVSNTTHPDTLGVSLSCPASGVLQAGTDTTSSRRLSLNDIMCGRHYNGLSISPSGRYVIVSTYETQENGQLVFNTEVRHAQKGTLIERRNTSLSWMPRTDKYLYQRTNLHRNTVLVAVDPETHQETELAEGLPAGHYQMSPTEDYLIYNSNTEGPKKEEGVYRILTPDDRQPGWRNRNALWRFDLSTGVSQPITFGKDNFHLCDISSDGRYALVTSYRQRLTSRPTSLVTLLRIDTHTLQCDTLVYQDGFISTALFSPDGQTIAVTGSPEAFGGIGLDIPQSAMPSMVDQQLYLIDLATRQVTAATRHFNPSVVKMQWSQADKHLYFTAEDKDYVRLFRLNPKTLQIHRVQQPEDVVRYFHVAADANVAFTAGVSASNTDRLYRIDLKRGTCQLSEDLGNRYRNVSLGECNDWHHINEQGDTVYCRYYLPPSFNANRSYPLIVYYYGGCSPTPRTFESHYSHHMFAALDYVVLVVNPRGATGFGQKWSAAHVMTAGEGVAQDIIGATKDFVAAHSYVNGKKIGCIGASYGGFMTQYLQTCTDLFAAAVSHAGISNHTSYWGLGYWGYSYSEVSMGDRYPWTDKHLYVDQSPLFNAQRINTPLLLIHGTADTNVPFNESEQLFTALKLLGKDVALVAVEGENHHITDFPKRRKWHNAIFAWFNKYLHDDTSWWEAIFPTTAFQGN